MTEVCFIFRYKQILVFEGQKRAQNDGFGSKSSSRKRSEVRLGPKWAGHLPRCCGRANTDPGVIHHDTIALGTSENTHVGSFGPLGGSLASRDQTKQTTVQRAQK